MKKTYPFISILTKLLSEKNGVLLSSETRPKKNSLRREISRLRNDKLLDKFEDDKVMEMWELRYPFSFEFANFPINLTKIGIIRFTIWEHWLTSISHLF